MPFFGHNCWESLRLLGADCIDGIIRLLLQHLAMEKQQGIESLILVEAETFKTTARWVREASISGLPISRG